MALGFSSGYSLTLSLDNLLPEQWLVLATEAARQLNWNITHLSIMGMASTTPAEQGYSGSLFTARFEGAVEISSRPAGGERADMGRNKRIVEDFIAKFEEVKSSLTDEMLAQRAEELKPQLTEPDMQLLNPGSSSGGVGDVLAMFKPVKGYFLTPILLIVNIVIFILMVIQGVSFFDPSAEDLVKWGANFGPYTLDGQWWRLLTCCFLHIGVLHLALNMYALLFIGVLLEPLLGSTKFSIAYVLTGISASLVSLCWNSFQVSAGASGAIFGMYGVFLAMLTTNLLDKSTRGPMLGSIAFFVGYNLLYGLKGGVDNAAHIGGLLSGVLIGYIYVPVLRGSLSEGLSRTVMALLPLVFVIGFIFTFNVVPNDIPIYEKKMDSFSSMEQEALQYYQMDKNGPNQELLNALKDKGVNNWKGCLAITGEIDKLQLPAHLKERNGQLKVYCNLRIKIYELIYKKIQTGSTQYDAQLGEFNVELSALVDNLKERE